jgi:glucose/arabinose dehydrogenase
VSLVKFLLVGLLCLSTSAISAKLKYEKIKSGQGTVWGMDFIEDKIIFTERDGQLKLLNLKTKKITIVNGSPAVYSKGQGGLLDIKLHPKFKTNSRVYLTYSKVVGNGQSTALGYGILSGSKLMKFKDIFIAQGKSSGGVHFGSRITFDENNNIFMSIGERGERKNSQNLKNHFGTVVKLTEEGGAAAGNPYIGNKNALDEIWSYGHRNPQGLAYDQKSKNLYEMEHGPRGGDEINLIKKAANYGWPIISYGKEYMLPMMVGESTKKEGMERPLKYYVPSIAPCGLAIYQGKRYPTLKNSLLAGALKGQHLNQVNLQTLKESRHFRDLNQRIRSVVVSPDDYIYFSTDSGEIYKIR